jgi:hypothetical protein
VSTGAESVVDLETAYEQMAQDKVREAAALDWADGTVADVADERGQPWLFDENASEPNSGIS